MPRSWTVVELIDVVESRGLAVYGSPGGGELLARFDHVGADDGDDDGAVRLLQQHRLAAEDAQLPF